MNADPELLHLLESIYAELLVVMVCVVVLMLRFTLLEPKR